MFASVLVANRGEIAVRVLRTLRRLGIRGIAVYSDADAAAPHVRAADVAVHIGPTPAAQSYLDVERVIAAARRTGAEAVHPGYGFLSEHADFARACAAAGVVFVGPPVGALESMGDKIAAKVIAVRAGVPVVPGVAEPGMDDAALLAAAAGVGYPLMVKAAAGGGGKGMRVVAEATALPAALAAARREALAAFGDDDLLLERFVPLPRHLEVQVLADAHGAVVSLGVRECSLQRRHQKVIEETPPALHDAPTEAMCRSAEALARAVGYVGVGTVEYIVPSEDPGSFAFLEMNTRLQVEHPVTEEVFGLDLVEQQLRVAAGERLAVAQRDLRPDGHAIEARVYAEDPARGFLPTGGRLAAVRWPSGDGVRVDAGVAEGSVVGSAYDPMLAKVIAHGHDRADALRRLDGALAATALLGVTTNVAFLRELLAHADVRAGALDTGLIGRLLDRPEATAGVPEAAWVVAALVDLAGRAPYPAGPVDPFDVPSAWRLGGAVAVRWELAAGTVFERVQVRGTPAAAEVAVGEGPWRSATVAVAAGGEVALSLDGEASAWMAVVDGAVTWLGHGGGAWSVRRTDGLARPRGVAEAALAGPLRAPLPGTVAVVSVTAGELVHAGQTLLVVEAMKMEHPITAPVDGIVTRVLVVQGQQVPMDAELAVIEAAPALREET